MATAMHPVAASGVSLCTECNATFMAPEVLQLVADLATKIRTNHIPTEVEKQEIAEILGGAEKKLMEHEEEIQKLRRITEELQGQRDALQKLVEGYRGLQAPIRQLPTETILQIFSLASWGDLWSSFFTKDDPSPLGLSPLNLVRVCSRWRSIVLQSKQLWTSVEARIEDDPRSYPNEISHSARALEMYLERSGDMPLSIGLDGILGDSYNDEHPYLPILVKHSHRWQHARMSLPSGYYTEHSALASIRGNLPNLQSLEFSSVEDTGNVFALCPKLNKIDFLYYLDASIDIPWNQLTTVHTRDESCDDDARDHLEILRMCPQIEEFHMSTNNIHDLPYPDVASNLKSLEFIVTEEWRSGEGVPSLLAALTLPRLKSFAFKIQVPVDQCRLPSDSLSSLFRRSSCPLQKLVLWYLPITDTDLIEVFRLLPTITELDLADDSGTVVTTALLQSLTYSASYSDSALGTLAEPLLPRLTKLYLTLEFEGRIDDDILLDVLQSRRQPEIPSLGRSSTTTTLKTCSVSHRTAFTSSSLRRLELLRSEGLDVIEEVLSIGTIDSRGSQAGGE